MMRRLVLTLALLVGCGEGMGAGTGGLSGDAGADAEPLPEQVPRCQPGAEYVRICHDYAAPGYDPNGNSGQPMVDEFGVLCYSCQSQFGDPVAACLVYADGQPLHCVADCNECVSRGY